MLKLSPRLLANLSAVGSTGAFKPAPLALLPPIYLLRRLLRAHRKYLLPKEGGKQARLLGDEYVKSEFRAHRNVENPIHIVRPLLTQTLNGVHKVRRKSSANGCIAARLAS